MKKPLVAAFSFFIVVAIAGTAIFFSWEAPSKEFHFASPPQPQQETQENLETKARSLAKSWIEEKSPTYTFDGSELTYRSTAKLECKECYTFLFRFASQQNGYGSRVNETPRLFTSPHTIAVRVENMKVTKAITDGTYDEIRESFINLSPPITDAPAETELIVEDAIVGKGPMAKIGDILLVNYTGKLENGIEFEKSYPTPFEFELGSPDILAGWNIGLEGMQAGGKRKLIIPPLLGYENQSHGIIPPNSTLIFDIELISLARKSS